MLQSMSAEFSGLGAPSALRSIQNIGRPKARLARAKSAPLPSIRLVQKNTTSTSLHNSSLYNASPNSSNPFLTYDGTNKPLLATKKQKVKSTTEHYVPNIHASFCIEFGSDIEEWINNIFHSIFSGGCEIPPPSLTDVDDDELVGLQFIEEEDHRMTHKHN